MNWPRVILTKTSLRDYIAPGVTVRELLALLKRMRNRSHFCVIYLGNGRHVSGGNGFSCSMPRSDNPEHIDFRRAYFCSPDPVWYRGWSKRRGSDWMTSDPIWYLEVKLRGDGRYFQIVPDQEALDSITDEDEKSHSNPTKTIWTDAWHDEDLVDVQLRSREKLSVVQEDIKRFVEAFAKAEAKIKNPVHWGDCGFDATVLCSCGHSKVLEATKLAGDSVVEDIFALKPSLRCSACEVKGDAEILPTYRKGLYAPNQAGFYSKGNNTVLDVDDFYGEGKGDLYNALGGNGENDVYLGDGASVTPEGKIVEN